MADHVETVLPHLTWLLDPVEGSLDSRGRLLYDDDQGEQRALVAWGWQGETYDDSPNAEVFYQAEALTPLGAAALAARTGASGVGNNVVESPLLPTDWTDILSTQIAATTAQLTHRGAYRVWARAFLPSIPGGSGGTEIDPGYSALFNGTSSRINFGDNYDFAAQAPFSVGVLINASDVSGNGSILSKYSTSANTGWTLDFIPGGELHFARAASGFDIATGTIAAGEVYHVIGAYDGSNLRLYVNGSLVSTVTSTRSLANTTHNLQLGAPTNNAAGRFFPGLMDEAFVCNAALDDATVAQLYADAIDPATDYSASVLALASLQSYWRLDETSGTFEDSKGAIDSTSVTDVVYAQSPLIGTGGAAGEVQNIPQVSVRLTYATGDLTRFLKLEPLSENLLLERDNFRIIPFGVVYLVPEVAGQHHWEGRIQAKSTVADHDRIEFDWIWLQPLERAGEARRGQKTYSQSDLTVIATDDFATGSGTLSGKSATGGPWVTAAPPGVSGADYAYAAGVVTRSATNSERWAYEESAADLKAGRLRGFFKTTALAHTTGGRIMSGFMARFVDNRNFVRIGMDNRDGLPDIYLDKIVAGIHTTLWSGRVDSNLASAWSIGNNVELTIEQDGSWEFRVWKTAISRPTTLLATGRESDLRTGGVLQSGAWGIYDNQAATGTRTWDNTEVSTRTLTETEGARLMHPNRSLEIRHDRAIVQDASGSIWQPVPEYHGDYMTFPPIDGPSRLTILSSRELPGEGYDPGIDDHSAKLWLTTRALAIPRP